VYLGNVVYAFAVILALYLIATFAGSRAYRRWMRRHEVDTLGPAWIPLGLLSLLPLLFADPRLPIPETLEMSRSLIYGTIRAGFAIVPFSALVGFLTPMLVDRWSGGNPDRAGRAYAVNVVGSILGPLVAGFWVLPWAGERWALCILSLPLFAVGLASARRSSQAVFAGRNLRPKVAFAATVIAALILAALSRDYGVRFRRRIELRDHTATVIATGDGMAKRLLVNGTGMTKLTAITKMMAHLPLSFLPQPPHKALVICFGMGTTFRSMMSWGIDVTAVELVPSVPKLFGYFHADGPELLRSPRAHLVIDDGRRFLERSGEQYDVIAADPPPPIGAPTSSLLYSKEFYSILKQHLRPGGIIQVWCPGGDDATMSAITKALRQSFPYIQAYESIEGWGTHYLVSMAPLPNVTPKLLVSRMPETALQDLIEFDRDSTPEQMFDDVLSTPESLDDLIKQDPSTPPIADDRPINEYFLLRAADPGLPL
jgi:spermidine synthase